MKKCPFCAEEIHSEATKCKHCGSMLPATAPAAMELHAKQHPSYGTFTLLAFLLPAIAFIIGIVYLTKSDPLEKKLGEHTLVTGIVCSFLWFLIILLFNVVFRR